MTDTCASAAHSACGHHAMGTHRAYSHELYRPHAPACHADDAYIVLCPCHARTCDRHGEGGRELVHNPTWWHAHVMSCPVSFRAGRRAEGPPLSPGQWSERPVRTCPRGITSARVCQVPFVRMLWPAHRRVLSGYQADLMMIPSDGNHCWCMRSSSGTGHGADGLLCCGCYCRDASGHSFEGTGFVVTCFHQCRLNNCVGASEF